LDGTTPLARRAVRDGIFAMLPLLLGVAPFGLIFGVTVAATSVDDFLGWATSFVIFAGAAQLATIELLDQAAPALVVIATALVINARHLMYSAALAPHFKDFPPAWRLAGPYLLTDQAFALSITRYDQARDATYKRWFYLSVGVTLWVVWQITTGLGVLLGAQIPASWNLDFAIPLVFLALLIPTMRTRPGLLAGVSGGALAVVARDLPNGTGLIVGALVGIAVGVVAERMRS
jgi:4-azaleucine resistance transporter AzlC